MALPDNVYYNASAEADQNIKRISQIFHRP